MSERTKGILIGLLCCAVLAGTVYVCVAWLQPYMDQQNRRFSDLRE